MSRPVWASHPGRRIRSHDPASGLCLVVAGRLGPKAGNHRHDFLHDHHNNGGLQYSGHGVPGRTPRLGDVAAPELYAGCALGIDLRSDWASLGDEGPGLVPDRTCKCVLRLNRVASVLSHRPSYRQLI